MPRWPPPTRLLGHARTPTLRAQVRTWPVVCPPSPDCRLERLNGKLCDPQGRLEPTVCPQASYCPSQWESLACPAGSFCPLGSVTPVACGPLESCPAGSSSRVVYTGLVAAAIADIVLLVAISYARRRQRARRATARPPLLGGGGGDAASGTYGSGAEGARAAFAAGVARACGRGATIGVRLAGASVALPGGGPFVLRGASAEVRPGRHVGAPPRTAGLSFSRAL
jgi:hypothetical protein